MFLYFTKIQYFIKNTNFFLLILEKNGRFWAALDAKGMSRMFFVLK